MITPTVIDEVTLWFSPAILGGPAHETDRMAIDRVAAETKRRPLAEIIDEQKDAGEFSLGQEAFHLASVVLPGVHGLVSAGLSIG